MSEFRAGAARSCITPPLGCHIAGYLTDRLAEDIADDLYAKAIVLDNGDTSLAFVECDLIVVPLEDCVRAKARAEELTGLPRENIFIAGTHTHYGPSPCGLFNVPREEAYMEWAMERVGDSVKLAQNRLRPAEVGHESGHCPEETHNRRRTMQDGTVQTNPGYQNPKILRPAGPTDPEVGVLVLRDPDGDPIAVLANYSLHYVGGPFSLSISADYFGAFDRALQRMAGSKFIAIMANGCCGDINNCDFTRPAPTYPHPFYQVERVADVVASRAFGAWRRIQDWERSPRLAAATEMVRFRRREPTPEEIAAAEALRAGPEQPTNLDWTYASEVLAVREEPRERDTPIQALAVGNVGIVGLPGEIFVEYGLQIKAQSPFNRTFVVELANDYVGYCPTDLALQEGGYETRLARSAKAAAGTEGAMVAASLRTLQAAKEERS